MNTSVMDTSIMDYKMAHLDYETNQSPDPTVFKCLIIMGPVILFETEFSIFS